MPILEKSVVLDYTYKNRQQDPLSLWLAVPPQMACQRVKKVIYSTEPQELSEYLGQELAYYQLEPGETINVSAEMDLYSSSLEEDEAPETLSPAEKQFYLRNTYLSPVNEAMREKAEEISKNAENPIDKLQCLFEHIYNTYTYHFPPEKRGASFFLKEGKGDCGEFSFLFCSYARALGIPCRSVIGAFMKKFQPHVWNECYIEEYGWVPIDTSVAASLKKNDSLLRHPLQRGESTGVLNYFGEFSGRRVVFCLDAEWPLSPEYNDTKAPAGYPLSTFGKENFAYGFQSLSGSAPYLQPIYTKFKDMPSPGKITDVLGTWNVRDDSLYLQSLLFIKQTSYYLFIAAMLANIAAVFFMDASYFLTAGYILAASGLGASILRKEYNGVIVLGFIVSLVLVVLYLII
ncbi:transglutaminase superfamily protein [Sinobaca qinghaiensis]|uniref:Transglutaminase superfamily protein n=1 Tax=Sinobaca qinghaiensis TaxID=342944 RepID=A0A419V525_9BACL|nr:transglutaminase domain-containing protein [Sinobaca qinghaiensis]RKD73628.1 transglutaminase superfamily protein [Sinobaca qinghaiensis]